MNKKTLIILCVIFAVLIGLIITKESMKPQVPAAIEGIVDIVEPSISLDNVTEITLRIGDGGDEETNKSKNVHLIKENGQWVVESEYGVYANDKVIVSAFEKLDQLQGELRSDKMELFDDYGISGEKALHVLLQHQDGVIHIVVGMEKAGYQNNFVRFGEKNAVYIVNENLLGIFGVRDEDEGPKLDTDKWIDKRITHLSVDDVVGIAIKQVISGAEETVIDIRKKTVDDKKQWQSVDPYVFGLSASKIQKMLEAFNNIYAREIIAPDVQGVFDAPGWTVSFTLQNGDEAKLVRGAKDADGKNYYAKLEGAGYFYLIPVTNLDNREKQQGDIFTGNPLKAEENNVDEIAVNDIEGKKKFHALKKAPAEAPEMSPEGTGDQAVEDKVAWQTPGGEDIEAAKVQDVIAKIKDMNLEVVPQSISLPKEALAISITKEGESKEYTISKDTTLDNGKECRFLKLTGNDQNYCVSKDQVSALQKALP